MAVLGLLKGEDLHGYELKRRLQELPGSPSTVSFGSLYPTLAKLEAAGAVEVVTQPAKGPTSALRTSRASLLRRRRRKVYRLTPAGSELFHRLLTEPSIEDERAFNLKLAFAGHLDQRARLRLLEQRRRVVAERLGRSRTKAYRADRYLRVLAAREHEELSRDLAWLDRLIAEERSLGPAGTEDGQVLPRQERPYPVPLASASQLRRGRGAAEAPTYALPLVVMENEERVTQ